MITPLETPWRIAYPYTESARSNRQIAEPNISIATRLMYLPTSEIRKAQAKGMIINKGIILFI